MMLLRGLYYRSGNKSENKTWFTLLRVGQPIQV